MWPVTKNWPSGDPGFDTNVRWLKQVCVSVEEDGFPDTIEEEAEEERSEPVSKNNEALLTPSASSGRPLTGTENSLAVTPTLTTSLSSPRSSMSAGSSNLLQLPVDSANQQHFSAKSGPSPSPNWTALEMPTLECPELHTESFLEQDSRNPQELSPDVAVRLESLGLSSLSASRQSKSSSGNLTG